LTRWSAHRSLTRALVVVLPFISLACSSNGSPTPPTSTNAPPKIDSLTAGSDRIEAGEELLLMATVSDAETNPSQLSYVWSVSPSGGTFTGSGREVRWRAPKPATTPNLYTVTLTVTETYSSSGTRRTNQTAASVQVHYNDSVPEIEGITRLFLQEFQNNSISPDQCVRNFSDTCAQSKAAERQDVQNNRDLFDAQSATVGTVNVALNGARTFATIEAPCTFRSIRKSTQKLEEVVGICQLTGVYESFRWFLCTSGFQLISGPTPLRSPQLLSHP
jgi:hypothetical protein